MKKFIITEEEKSKILKMYLGEQEVTPNQNQPPQSTKQNQTTPLTMSSTQYIGDESTPCKMTITYQRAGNEFKVTNLVVNIGGEEINYATSSNIPSSMMPDGIKKGEQEKTNTCKSLFTLYYETRNKLENVAKENNSKVIDDRNIFKTFTDGLMRLPNGWSYFCKTNIRNTKTIPIDTLTDYKISIMYIIADVVNTSEQKQTKTCNPIGFYVHYPANSKGEYDETSKSFRFTSEIMSFNGTKIYNSIDNSPLKSIRNVRSNETNKSIADRIVDFSKSNTSNACTLEV